MDSLGRSGSPGVPPSSDISRISDESSRANEEQIRWQAQLLELARDGIMVRGMDGAVLYWSRGAEEMYGWRKEEALGELVHSLLQAEYPKPLKEIEADVRRDGHWEGELVHTRRDGTRCIVASRWTLQRDDSGKPAAILELNYDITKRKQAEEALRHSEERNRWVIDTANDAFIAMDAEGKITEWNRPAEITFGWSREEAIGRTLAETIIPPQYREAHKRGLQHFLATGQGPVLNKRIEITGLHRDGHELHVELTIAPIRWGTGYVFNSFVHDITERKEAEERIRQMNEVLEQRARALEAANKELEAFTYSVSHDLRAPLRHIDGFSRLLLEEHSGGLDPQGRRFLERVREGTRQMGNLVDDLLNLSRISRKDLNLRVSGLDAIVEDVLYDLKPALEGREIEFHVGRLPSLLCDPGLLKLALSNLLSNAIKFTRPRAHGVIEVGQTKKDDSTVIFVRDNGVGFDVKYADKLFGVFQRLHREEDFEGTGVGLALVQRIIDKHGGRIWADGALNQGATFYFTLDVPELARAAATSSTQGTSHDEE